MTDTKKQVDMITNHMKKKDGVDLIVVNVKRKDDVIRTDSCLSDLLK